jgi:SAM-dependent methyltransferase
MKIQEILATIDRLEEAHIVLAALELRVFTHLDGPGLSAAQLARKARATREGTEALLDALTAMGVLRKRGEHYRNTPDSQCYLSEKSAGYLRGTVFLKKGNRSEWENLLGTIRHGRNLAAFEGDDDPAFREEFSHAMHERSGPYAYRIAAIVTRRPIGDLLDLGSGPGSYSAAILKRAPSARAILIDRGAALTVAKALHRDSRIVKRMRFCPGNLFEADYGENRDTVLYSNILHIYNPAENKRLLRKIHQSLAPGGRLLMVDLFLKDNRTEPYDAALFSLTMLMYTRTGRTYTLKETRKLLKETGFGRIEVYALEGGSSLLEAVRKK